MIQIIFIFTLGLCVGSFLNVLIDRLPKTKPIFLSRSYCDHCHRQLSWYDLIPLFSFIILEGKCRYCRKKLSWKYPLVESTTGLLFAYTFATMIYIIEAERSYLVLAYSLIVVSGLTVIFFTDLKYRIIPDQIIIILSLVSVVYLLFFQRVQFLNYLLAAMVGFLIFLALVIVTRGKGMGLGDVKYAFLMGLLLGVPKFIVAFYLAFLTGAVISLILVVMGRKTFKSTIPFGPFLVAATFISLFHGQELWLGFRRLIGL